MRIAIIGAGASGIYSAILLKKEHPEAEIVVFEKEEKIARKLYATGNGHCNLLNRQLTGDAYNNPEFMDPLLKRYPYLFLKELLKSWGIAVQEEGDYVYPGSYNAATYVGLLEKIARALGIHFVLATRVLDYQAVTGGYCLKIDKNIPDLPLIFEKVIFAVGGKSTPKLGSDGRFEAVLKNHGYRFKYALPGLAPVKVVNPSFIKGMAGYRHHALVRLLNKTGDELYQEEGEVLFKEDGLSGIVIFNVESVYCRYGLSESAKIALDYFPDKKAEELSIEFAEEAKLNPSFFLDSFFPEEIQKHFLRSLSAANVSSLSHQGGFEALANLVKNDEFLIDQPYGFDNSQVTVGGLSLLDVNEHLESKREKGIFFTGELLDINGKCGGFNLTWALISALLVKEGL
jgi:predicted Rossmann fold flavoprotein